MDVSQSHQQWQRIRLTFFSIESVRTNNYRSVMNFCFVSSIRIGKQLHQQEILCLISLWFDQLRNSKEESSSAHRCIECCFLQETTHELVSNSSILICRWIQTYTPFFLVHESELIWMVVMMRESEHNTQDYKWYYGLYHDDNFHSPFTLHNVFTYQQGDWTANWNICSSEHRENDREKIDECTALFIFRLSPSSLHTNQNDHLINWNSIQMNRIRSLKSNYRSNWEQDRSDCWKWTRYVFSYWWCRSSSIHM